MSLKPCFLSPDISSLETKALEKSWKQYRSANQLNMTGDPLDIGN
jgi:hypothetical protein